MKYTFGVSSITLNRSVARARRGGAGGGPAVDGRGGGGGEVCPVKREVSLEKLVGCFFVVMLDESPGASGVLEGLAESIFLGE